MRVDPESAHDGEPKREVHTDGKRAYARPVLTSYGAALNLTLSSTGGKNDPGSGSKTRTQ